MKKLLFLLLLFPASGLWASTPEQCGEPQAGGCSFYLDCIEEKFECGYIGYPVSYGFKYCKKFKNAKKFSPRGKKWVASTMLCLQQRLVPFM